MGVTRKEDPGKLQELSAIEKVVRVMLLVGTVMVFILTFTFHSMAFTNTSALFPRTITEVFAEYAVDMTSARATEPQLRLITLGMQALWLTYALTTICKKCKGSSLFLTVPYLSNGMFVSSIASMLFSILWVITWSRTLIWVSFGAQICSTVTSWITCWLCARSFVFFGPVLIDEKLQTDLKITRLLVLNMNGVFAISATSDTAFALATILRYKCGLVEPIASAVCICLLMAMTLCWALTEMTSLDVYTRNFMAPYLKLLTLVAIIVNKPDDRKLNHVLKIIFLSELCIVSVVKLGVSIIRRKRYGPEPLIVSQPNERTSLLHSNKLDN